MPILILWSPKLWLKITKKIKVSSKTCIFKNHKTFLEPNNKNSEQTKYFVKKQTKIAKITPDFFRKKCNSILNFYVLYKIFAANRLYRPHIQTKSFNPIKLYLRFKNPIVNLTMGSVYVGLHYTMVRTYLFRILKK